VKNWQVARREALLVDEVEGTAVVSQRIEEEDEKSMEVRKTERGSTIDQRGPQGSRG
jgi:hypothetical protein